MRIFINDKKNNKICPKCGSLSRTRQLFKILIEEFSKINTVKRTLHFSPSKSIASRLRNNKNLDYLTSDFVGEFESDMHYNILDVNEPDQSFNYIICYHILEHISDDSRAIQELYRILKVEGKCFIQTPFKEGHIYENDKIVTPKERLKHFGQEDHLRIYSVSGLTKRLEYYGFKVNILQFNNKADNTFGLSTNETVLVAEK